MKTKILFLFVLCLIMHSCITMMKPPARDYTIEEQKKKFYIKELNNTDVFNKTSKPNVFRLDKKILSQLCIDNPKKYLALYTFNCWTEMQTELLNSVINKYENDSTALFLLSTDDWTQRDNTIKYVKQLNYQRSLFMLDIERYGISLNPNIKIKRFMKELDYDISMGFHLLIIFDSSSEIKKYSIVNNVY